MLDIFDSRMLRLTDSYGQRFMKAGTFRYHVVPTGAEWLIEARPFVVNVVEGSSKNEMLQHNVAVRAEGAAFSVDQPELSIGTGDLVLWHCSDRKTAPYAVIGDKEFFASHRLVNESGYAHAFRFAGEYSWRDALGGDLNGVVRVRNANCERQQDFRKWYGSLRTAALVMISDTTAEPREIEITLGQTVFFVVTKSRGISITDERALQAGRPQLKGRKARMHA